MAIEIQKYRIDFSTLIDRDQSGNAVAWSLDIFKDKSVYLQVLECFVSEANELYLALIELAKVRTIADARGAWLDGLGKIVGQEKEFMPSDGVPVFFVWDSETQLMDSYLQWITGVAESGSYDAPTDADYKDQIVRRIFQNVNQSSSIPEIKKAVLDTIGLEIKIEQTGVRKIKLWVPAGTPEWQKYLLTGKSFSVSAGGYNRWYLPFPAACEVDATIGEY